MNLIIKSVFVLFLVTNLWAQTTCKKEDIMKTVDEACQILTKEGKAGLTKLSDDKFKKKCGTFVWVHEATGLNNMLFHPYTPGLNSKPMKDLLDPNGKRMYDCFNGVTKKSGDSGWCEYAWSKPEKDSAGKAIIATKCSYVKNCDGKFVPGMGPFVTCKDLGVTPSK